jgi:hypothetical protein
VEEDDEDPKPFMARGACGTSAVPLFGRATKMAVSRVAAFSCVNQSVRCSILHCAHHPERETALQVHARSQAHAHSASNVSHPLLLTGVSTAWENINITHLRRML